MELERFKKKQYTARMRSNFWKVSMGIAAMIAVLFGTYYLINTLTTPALEPITVFTADAAPQHITLQKDNGEKIVLDKPQSNNQTLPQKMISSPKRKNWITGKSFQRPLKHMYSLFHAVKVSR